MPRTDRGGMIGLGGKPNIRLSTRGHSLGLSRDGPKLPL